MRRSNLPCIGLGSPASRSISSSPLHKKGLIFVGSPNMIFEDLAGWAARRVSDGLLVKDDDRCKPYAEQLIEYFQGERTSFTLPMDIRGTPFQQEVWEALQRIPYGETRSYSDISDQLGKPLSTRAVGTAIGANPLLITIPCHRVIAKDGSLAGYRGGLDMKKKLLKLEGNLLRDMIFS